MKHHESLIVLGLLFGSAVAAAAAPAANSADYLPVDQDVWTILMAEPDAHLLSAKEDLAEKDTKGAAAEIRLAGTFLKRGLFAIKFSRLTAAHHTMNGRRPNS
jgi:hypothetical protein